MKRNALLIVAAAFFLLVVGWNAYSIVCLPEHWEVNCYCPSSEAKFSSRTTLI